MSCMSCTNTNKTINVALSSGNGHKDSILGMVEGEGKKQDLVEKGEATPAWQPF